MKKLGHRTKLAGAVAAAMLGGSIAGSASANVSLTVDGFGDAGIVQYYTVKGEPAWQTFFRMFNNSDYAVAVKVRFREGANSRETLDFVVWLSPHDSWHFWTTPDANGSGPGAIPGIRTRDNSCITPGPQFGSPTETFGYVDDDITSGMRYANFKTSAITPPYADGTALTAEERVKEGHVEVIGLAAWEQNTPVYTSVSHEVNANGDSKPSCAGLEDFAFGEPWGGIADDAEVALDVPNVLAMNAYLVRLGTGQGAGFEPVVLANFAEEEDDAQRMLWEQVTDSQKPDLDSGGLYSFVTDVDNQVIYSDTWDGALPVGGVPREAGRENLAGPNGWQLGTVRGGIDAVSATLTRTAVVNEWIRRATPDSILQNTFSQWVVTFPTKNYYVDSFLDPIPTLMPFDIDNIYPTLDCSVGSGPDACAGGPNAAPYAPFSENYGQVLAGETRGESCDNFRMTMWNNDEQGVSFTSPTPTFPAKFCHEVNVIEFGESRDLASGIPLGLDANFPVEISEELFPPNPNPSLEPGYPKADMGWARLQFWENPARTEGLIGTDYAYYGLPVTGFNFLLYQTRPGSASGNAAMIVPHKDERCVEDVGTQCDK